MCTCTLYLTIDTLHTAHVATYIMYTGTRAVHSTHAHARTTYTIWKEGGEEGGISRGGREGGKERDETLDSAAHLAAHLLQAASSCEIGLVFQYISVACLVKIKLSMLADIIMHVYSRNKGQGLNTLDPPPCELCIGSKVTRARALEVATS